VGRITGALTATPAFRKHLRSKIHKIHKWGYQLWPLRTLQIHRCCRYDGNCRWRGADVREPRISQEGPGEWKKRACQEIRPQDPVEDGNLLQQAGRIDAIQTDHGSLGAGLVADCRQKRAYKLGDIDHPEVPPL
jgi:hypothetical protein